MSPGFTTPSVSLFTFVASIFADFIVSGSSTLSPSTIAAFFISPVASSVTSTFIVNTTSSFAGTVTFPKSTLLSSTSAVSGVVPVTLNPSGTSSVTSTVPAAFPLFVNVIVYANVSPGFTTPSVSSFTFVALIFTVFIVSGSSTSFPLTIAIL